MDNRVRLQKYIADAGIASRRRAEEMIAAGKVKVNGTVEDKLGTKVDPDFDKIEINGEQIKISSKKYYIMLNKPSGFITTTSDTHDRPTVMELVKDINARLYPVGRLDVDTEGLLLMTNDGDFANQVIHPSHSNGKVYIAEVKGLPPLELIKQFAKGIDIGDCITRPAYAELISGNERVSTVKVIINEGKKRQVRRMFEAIEHPVISLKRVEIGPVMLGNLPKGKWRHLRKEEVDRLMKNKG